jgi:selenocysteine lyase/cysteine desulfurase
MRAAVRTLRGVRGRCCGRRHRAATITTTPSASDFDHHHPRVARLNHGSFGACPRPVLDAQDAFRREWLAHPDGLYFTGRVHDGIDAAAAAAATALSPQPISPGHVALVENATVAAVAVARRWAKRIRPGDVVVHLSYAYKACVHVLREHCEREGATLVELEVPWLCATEDEICEAVDAQLAALEHGRLRYAFLDHVSSQPAVLLPIKRLVALCREHGAEEVCVDGAHSVGSVPDLDVVDIDADFFFTNFHKWGFAPSTVSALHARDAALMRTTGHPITSWDWKEGLAREAAFPGSRDFSAMMALPAAVDYLHAWRSPEGMRAEAYCHARVREAAAQLRFVWGTEDEDPAAGMRSGLVATQEMVMLPRELVVYDTPGTPGDGLRGLLRDEYNVEAAIGNFGPDKGGAYVRLSFAVYNSARDVKRLRDAVMEILDDQRMGF